MEILERAEALKARVDQASVQVGKIKQNAVLKMVPGLSDALPGVLSVVDELIDLQVELAREIITIKKGVNHGEGKPAGSRSS